MASSLNRRLNKRKAMRTQFLKSLSQVQEYLVSGELEESKLSGFESALGRKGEELRAIDDDIQNEIEEDEVEKDVEESYEILEPLDEVLASLGIKLSELRVSKSANESGSTLGSAISASSSAKSVKCKLPKLEIPAFSGEPLEWQGFWDRFKLSIDSNDSVSDVDKFNYLLRFLSGKALSCVKGLTLSSENYQQALDLLKERFGNPQVLISAHMDKLIKIKRVREMDNLESLRKLYNEVETCLRNLNSLKVEHTTYGCLLISILKDKLPEELLVTISRGFGGDQWTLERFMKFFDSELKAKENCLAFSSRKKGEGKSSEGYTTCENFHIGGDKMKFRCVYCLKNHSSSRCDKITDVAARKGILERYRKCFICLGGGHIAGKCRSSFVCKKCGGRHHISICSKSETESTTISHVGGTNGILLQTVSSKVSSSPNGSFSNARLLLDNGSQRSYISESLRQKLGLKTIRQERILIKPFGYSEKVARTLDIVQLFVQVDFERSFCLEVICFPHLCDPLTNQNISYALQKFPSLKSLKLADSNPSCSDLTVDILVGVDYYHNFFTGKIFRTRGGPTANETYFGWVLSGKISQELPDSSASNLVSHVMKCAVDQREVVTDDLRQDLERFWKVESVQDAEDCVIHKFEKDISFNGERYVTKLPFRPDHPPLPDNEFVCTRRLKSMHGKLLKDEGVVLKYDGVIKQYEKERIIERVPDEERYNTSNGVHYLPHRGVINEERETTKLRVVFDASCKVGENPSLNNCLYPGPNLISKIFDILLRFRLNPIAVISDIKQAFNQVEIHPEHQDFLRFLWYENPLDSSSPLISYRFLRLVMGLTSSPFILNATIRHHLQKFEASDSVFVNDFLRDLYVDDCPSGSASLSEAKEFYEKSSSILKSGGFLLRKWNTNSKELQTFFDEKESPESKGSSRLKKVLGVEWDLDSDEFVFRFGEVISLARSLLPTKRNVLKVAATFFDPIGFISPITARVKTIFQLLCKDKSDWDSDVPPGILSVWNTFLDDITRFGELRVKRFSYVNPSDSSELFSTLHGFCDSSETAYAAVLYLQVRTQSTTEVFFLAAKNRVAPLKKMSMPRLELSGCLLLSELVSQVKAGFGEKVSVDATKCWSDSQVALCWLKGKSKSWKPWVENRVVNIRKVVDSDDWSYVPGKDNPADIPTRVCELSDFDRWFVGPEVLRSCESRRDDLFDVVARSKEEDVLVEAKKFKDVTTTTVTIEEVQDVSKVLDCKRFSSFSKLIGTTAYVLRFINTLKARVKRRHGVAVDEQQQDGIITAGEREAAEMLWIKSEQNIIRCLPQFEKLTKSLNLFEDDNGSLRLKGRFGSTNLDNNVKYPLIISGKESYFTELLVRHCHEQVLHTGVETTLNYLRNRFWIVKGRQTVKSLLRKCVVCKRHQGRTLKPPETPNLPSFRFEDSFSFCNVGLDYAGPLYIRETAEAAAKKVYILLFTCATSRAVHLELVPNMKSSAFIRSFERFKSRKGTPRLIINDNFKTFKSTEVKKYLSMLGIRQKFILPSSPWWGGFYERLVRSVKLSLKKSLGRSLLTYEQLETVLCKSEFVINNRPLTYISSDDLEQSLTPFHLLFGRNVTHPEEQSLAFDVNFTNKEVNRRAKYLNKLIRNSWKSFTSFYLNELRQHHLNVRQRFSPSPPPTVGDIVIIRDDIPLPRHRWRMGKITELITGRDQKVRGVKLLTSTDSQVTEASRPLQKIIPLEITDTIEIPPSTKRHTSEGRPKRQAAREGQLKRRLKEKYG